MTLKPIFAGFLLCASFSCHAQWVKENHDLKTIAQVGINTTAQVGVEESINLEMEEISKKRETEALYRGSIAVAHEAYHYALRNVKDFGQESYFYKRIEALATNIIELTPMTIKSISSSRLPGKASALVKVGELGVEAAQAAQDFINICTNCKLKNPFKDSAPKKSDDGHNLLERRDRINVAVNVINHLGRIRYILMTMYYRSKYGDWLDIIKQVDFDSYAYYLHGKLVSERIISQFKKS